MTPLELLEREIPLPNIVPEVIPEPESPVAREARRLDRLFPGWAERIDLGFFHLADPFRCVLGQGVPQMPYDEAINIVNTEREAEGLEVRNGVYAMHTRWGDEWIAEIKARR